MRIVLLYPPPWKIPAPGEDADQSGEGPPSGWKPDYLFSGDIIHIPYGLLTLSAHMRNSGYEVAVLNLYTFAWRDVREIIRLHKARVYGLSCFSSNRRGVLATARLIRELHPYAHITAGGPHASALPREMLEHCKAIDTVIIGEGEKTFTELVSCLAGGTDIGGIPGIARRINNTIVVAPARSPINDLDTLVPPAHYFDDYILLTSRGCAWNCTFCASPFLWGKKVRYHSSGYVLDMLEHMVNIQGRRALGIKDDTFTANRTRVLEICRGIVKQKLNFLWSCDTRADTLDEEMLFAMREAGCERISLGIESAHPEILRLLNKKTAPEEVLAATGLAKKFGFQIRYYLIAGTRGETAETLSASVNFVKQAKPSQFIFNPFTLFPGTEEFAIAEKSGAVNRTMFFSDDFFELIPQPHEVKSTEMEDMIINLNRQPGVQPAWDYSVSERESILKLFPELSAAHMDLGGALYGEENLAEAEKIVKKALDMDYPLPGLGYNYLACIAYACADLKKMLNNLIQARNYGFHQVVEANIEAIREWMQADGPRSGKALALCAHHRFEITTRKEQPVTPAPVIIHEPDAPPHVFTPLTSYYQDI